MFGLGGHWEWILIFLVILLIFGGRKLPEVARGLGKAINEFRKARDELHDVVRQAEQGAGQGDDAKQQKEEKQAEPGNS